MANQTTTIESIPLVQLRFDPLNPRLPSTIKGNDNSAVIAYLLRQESLIELMGSIGEQGYFAGEPLLVCPSPTEKDAYWVVEGNRRLGAVMLLNKPELAPTTNKISVNTAATEAKIKPSELPAVVYKNREAILNYLSYRHVTGVKAWNPLQKAKYLKQLQEQLDISLPMDQQFRSLAKSIGTRSDYVARLLTGYSLYNHIATENFYNIPNLNEETLSFSVLTTALTYTNIREWIGLTSNADPTIEYLNKPRLKELVHWMFALNTENKTRLGESRNLKYLSAVVANDRALLAFQAGEPLMSANNLTEEPAELFRTTLNLSKSQLTTARDIFHLVEVPTSGDEAILGEIQALARNMRTLVNAKILEAEDND